MSSPNVISGQAIGTTITVNNSTDLANLPTQGLTIGTQVYNVAVGSNFILTLSNASLVTDKVVSVLGITGYRWVIFQTSGGGPWLNQGADLYVSPGGDNTNPGNSWTQPFLSINKAIAVAEASGGGHIHIAPGSIAHDSVSGAGVWIRGANDIGLGGPGWLTVNTSIWLDFLPVREGILNTYPQGFMSPGMGAGRFTDSLLQIAGTAQGIVVSNLQMGQGGTDAFPASRLGLSSPLRVWSSGVTYAINDVVSFSGSTYGSTGNGNINHQPDVSPSQWNLLRSVGDGLVGCLTAFVKYDNCSFYKEGANSGPSHDVCYAFWVWYEQCTWIRVGAVGGNDIANCGFRALGQFGGGNVVSYLNSITNCRADGGGIYSEGANGWENVQNFTGENMFMAMWHGEANTSGVPYGDFRFVTQSDSGFTFSLVNGSNGRPRATDCANISGIFQTDYKGDLLPTFVGVMGRMINTDLMQDESARRLGSLPSVRFTNYAPPLSAIFGSGQITGPLGEPVSSSLAYSSSSPYLLWDGNASGSPALSAGDRIAFGLWLNFLGGSATDAGFTVSNEGTGSIVVQLGLPCTGGCSQLTLSGGADPLWLNNFSEANSWGIGSNWLKIISITAGAKLKIATGIDLVGRARPFAYYIPVSDTTSDNEVHRLALSVNATPVANHGTTLPYPNPNPGQPALFQNQKLAFWDATLNAWKYLDIDNGAVRIT